MYKYRCFVTPASKQLIGIMITYNHLPGAGKMVKIKKSGGMMGNVTREAFDLHNPACRNNFKRAIKYKWHKGYWWRLVISDTLNNVCPRIQPPEDK